MAGRGKLRAVAKTYLFVFDNRPYTTTLACTTFRSMEERSQTEQERDIRELLRRAERSPVKTSTLVSPLLCISFSDLTFYRGQRRDALKRLIDLAHSPYPNLKLIAATNLKHFIKDFPDFEDDAINAVYDLCEDQVSKVRPSPLS